MFKFRMVAQALVALFVFLAAASRFGYSGEPSKSLTLVAVLGAIWLITNRTTWLPFLGPTVMPAGALRVQQPKDADLAITLDAPPEAIKCVFWGSVLDSKNPYEAYGGYTNAGVADVRADGTVVINLKKPKPYWVWGKRISAHVHYRWVGPRGMLSAVRTQMI